MYSAKMFPFTCMHTQSFPHVRTFCRPQNGGGGQDPPLFKITHHLKMILLILAVQRQYGFQFSVSRVIGVDDNPNGDLCLSAYFSFKKSFF